MTEAFIVDAIRTPVGRRGGGLAHAHPADMAAAVLAALVDRTGIDPEVVDDVVLGCLDQVGPQSGDIARTAWLAAGLPESVPGTTVDRQCGSSQQALHFAAQGVMSGTQDLVVAGGTQNMSRIPIMGGMAAGAMFEDDTDPWSGSVGWRKRYGDEEVSQFRGAELMADRWDIDRDEMERFALQSHHRAIAAIDEGRFEREILPFEQVVHDEGPRRDTSLERLQGLKTLAPGGRLTAGVASQISDGASAMLVASEAAVERYGLTPRARVHHLDVRGADPIEVLSAPIPATRRALERTGMTMDDIDLVEINEAFAPVVLAWAKELSVDEAKINVNGGAIALGHPLGATGTRLMTTLLHELERTGGRFGLQTMCEGGGMANVTIIERLG
ncbi:acetyl-CoA C-acetyltransferase [Nitriliruptor alkaliphilus]|uniref:acetyl-CoA C-acetyltransferase n=1 Tax=Nitriliruptor alkaliphilus TaxID=427918 RepID=UPI0006978E7B|nr:acetyl-CoA C-acetyltransferase [Nitriliruptor alkaliphilus]